jgi:DNA polymerase/3'-5' exonuclease PolX
VRVQFLNFDFTSYADGIGKGSSDKIYEFLETGKIEKLEEKRALNAWANGWEQCPIQNLDF